MSLISKKEGVCCACSKPIHIGDLIEQAADRLPVQHNGWVHEVCPTPRKEKVHYRPWGHRMTACGLLMRGSSGFWVSDKKKEVDCLRCRSTSVWGRGRYDLKGPTWRKPMEAVTLERYPEAVEIWNAGFTTRVRNLLIRNYVWDLNHAELASAEQLLEMRGFGRQSIFDFGIRMRELDRAVDPDIFDWMAAVQEKEGPARS